MKPKNTICWFDKDALEAARFYAATFPDSKVTAVLTPRALTDALAAGGGEAKRAFEAMMTMKKIDIATIEAARRG
jgi:predicted 3-demethylubiquinone-9 3-methyltransferase (glyoxalase superfamily)